MFQVLISKKNNNNAQDRYDIELCEFTFLF